MSETAVRSMEEEGRESESRYCTNALRKVLAAE